MSEGQPQDLPPPPENYQPGFCSATGTDKMACRAQLNQPDLKTSDLFATCNLPKRFEHPRILHSHADIPNHYSTTIVFTKTIPTDWRQQSIDDAFCGYILDDWFNGYGCQVSSQHPFYRTSSSEYGWYPPGYYSVPTVFFPAGQRFTNALSAAGMYRNYSLNTGMDQAGYQ